MPQMSTEIKKVDKLSIYIKTFWKIMRGLCKFGLKYDFPIFIGKSVEITHRKHIKCGKNVKFESYSEIHGLARDGLLDRKWCDHPRWCKDRKRLSYWGWYLS